MTVGVGILILVLVVVASAAAFVIYHRRSTSSHTQSEDALKHLFDCDYRHQTATLASLAGTLGVTPDAAAQLLDEMARAGLVAPAAQGWALTEAGRLQAARIVRAHRLWERHLADRTGYSASEWHRQSERREHAMTPEAADTLAAELAYPRFDPHGDPIPTKDGHMPAPSPHHTLAQMTPGARARVAHVEDEPAVLYDELLAGGIYVGMPIDSVTVDDGRVVVQSGATTLELSVAAAENVTVTNAEEARQVHEVDRVTSSAVPLSVLRPGEVGRVLAISPQCLGTARSRFLDLGILPGTLVRAEMVSPSGDPTAYRIRGALIGLRREQADMITIERVATMDQADAVKLGATV